MDLEPLIEALSRPTAYPGGADHVVVHQTHISAVFLAGEHAYKIKKPVNLGFLDFTTLERRRHFCHEEVRLNRRLAPDVYLGVVPIRADAAGALHVESAGDTDEPAGSEAVVIEWAVRMRRLPDEATLDHRLQDGQDVGPWMRVLGQRLAEFHARADRGAHIAHFGSYEVVERNALENFDQSARQVGTTVSAAVFERLRGLTEGELARHRPLIEARATRGVPCDTHGDLRPGHVYLFPEQAPPANLVIVDCIEFNERFRFSDPVADIAFLAMGLQRAGHAELAAAFCEAYVHAAGDDEGRRLLPFYIAYRAAVRGKVDGMQTFNHEIPERDRAIALAKARGFWLLGLGALEAPQRRPCLLVIVGLPGTGKSTLAADLAARAGCEVIRSDVVRKELAGAAPAASQAAPFGEGIYTPEWTERTYDECRRRAEQLLFEGRRVIVDASFNSEAQRQTILEAAIHWGVPPLILECTADAAVVRARLAARTGDASDADWQIYEQAAARWQPPGPLAARHWVTIDTSAEREAALQQALGALKRRGLWE
ncbi:MAG: AAA family ATPase [Pirellulales bacterium]